MNMKAVGVERDNEIFLPKLESSKLQMKLKVVGKCQESLKSGTVFSALGLITRRDALNNYSDRQRSQMYD